MVKSEGLLVVLNYEQVVGDTVCCQWSKVMVSRPLVNYGQVGNIYIAASGQK